MDNQLQIFKVTKDNGEVIELVSLEDVIKLIGESKSELNYIG